MAVEIGPARLRRQTARLIDAVQSISMLIDDGLFSYRRAFPRFSIAALRCCAIVFVLTQAVSALSPRLGRGWISPDVLFPSLYGLLVIYFSIACARRPGAGGERPAAPLTASVRAGRALGLAGLYVGGAMPIFFVLMRAGRRLLGLFSMAIEPFFRFVTTGGLLVLWIYGPMLVLAILLYLLQPWLHESRPFGDMLRRCRALAGYRLAHTLLACALAALLGAAAVVLVLLADFALLERVSRALPLGLGLGRSQRSYVLRQLWLYAVLMPSLALTLPPLPIWMALLYRRNRTAYEGADLQAKVEKWRESEVRMSHLLNS